MCVKVQNAFRLRIMSDFSFFAVFISPVCACDEDPGLCLVVLEGKLGIFYKTYIFIPFLWFVIAFGKLENKETILTINYFA